MRPTISTRLTAPPPRGSARARRSTCSGAKRSTEGAAFERSRARSSGSAKKRRIAAARAAGSPGGTSSPFSPSRTTSGDAAHRGRDHGRPDRQRLDDRVREVLPRRRENRRVGAAEEREHLVAADRAEELDARVEPELRGLGLERHALVAVAGEPEGDAVAGRDRRQRHPEVLRRGQPAGERERRALPGRPLGQRRQRRRRVREHRDALGRHAPARGQPGEEAARADHVGRR